MIPGYDVTVNDARMVNLAGKASREMLGELKAFPLLAGYRGRPPGDVDAACAAIAAFSRAVLALGDQVAEVEVNPLLVKEAGQGACMLDALAVPSGQ